MKLFHQSTGSVYAESSPNHTSTSPCIRLSTPTTCAGNPHPRFSVSKNPIAKSSIFHSRHIDTWLAGRAKPSLKAVRDSPPPSGFLFHSVDREKPDIDIVAALGFVVSCFSVVLLSLGLAEWKIPTQRPRSVPFRPV